MSRNNGREVFEHALFHGGWFGSDFCAEPGVALCRVVPGSFEHWREVLVAIEEFRTLLLYWLGCGRA